ncbi:MAG: hypothetical protein JXP73_01105 [Deltaproteobacteria bacterium]|nr:hypothetical protein [Deltaproteobacteria bacterium]
MSARSHSRWFYFVAAALLAFAALALFGRALFFGQTFAERDLSAFYYPAKWLLAPLAEASGGIPLWNPFFGSGQPFAGNPEHEIFHPMTFLFFVLPFEWAFRLQVILPPLLAVPCMYWFLRVLRRSRPAALAGGLAWGFGGFMLSATCLLPELLSAFPLPLTLGFSVLLLRRPTVPGVVGLAFCLALQCLAGEPGTLLPLLPLLLIVWLAESSPARRRGTPWVLLGLVLGLGIAAAALLPGFHHAARTVRAAGLTDAMANEWSMAPVRILELFTPHVLGHVDRGDLSRYWGRGYYGAKTFAFYYSLYPGLLVSLLAIRSWGTRRRALLLWGAAAVLGYLVALGDRFVPWPLLRHLPGLSGIRFPEKASLLFFFPTLVAGSYGFDWVVMARRPLRGLLFWALPALAAVGLLLAVALTLWCSQPGSGFSSDDAVRDALRVSVVALGLWGLLGISRGWRRQRRGLLLCAALCLDLVTVGRDLVPTVPIEALATPPEVLKPLLRTGRDALIFHMAEWDAKRSEVGGLAKPPRPARWGLRMTLERDFDFTQLRWTFESTRAWMRTANEEPRLIEPLLERRGVTAIVRIAPGVGWQGNRLVRPDGGPIAEVLFAKRSNGFVFAASRVEIVHGARGWQEKVRALGSEVVTTACVEDTELRVFENPPGPAELQLRRRTPEYFTVAVEAKGPHPSFLAINQTWDPNWRVTLDGKQARLLRTDLALSGVIVPPGAHRVEFEYRDSWVSAGLAISALASMGALLALLLARRRARAVAGRVS